MSSFFSFATTTATTPTSTFKTGQEEVESLLPGHTASKFQAANTDIEISTIIIPYSPNITGEAIATNSTEVMSGFERIWMVPPFVLGAAGVGIFLFMMILTIAAMVCRMNRSISLSARRKSAAEIRKPLYVDFNYPVNAFSPQPNFSFATKPIRPIATGSMFGRANNSQLNPGLPTPGRDLHNRSPIYATTTEAMQCRRPEPEPLPPSNLGLPTQPQSGAMEGHYATASLHTARLRAPHRPISMYDGYMDPGFQYYPGYPGGHWIPKARMVSDPALIRHPPPPPVILRQNNDYIRLLRDPLRPPSHQFLEELRQSKESLRQSKDTLDSLPPPPPPAAQPRQGEVVHPAQVKEQQDQTCRAGLLHGNSLTSEQSVRLYDRRVEVREASSTPATVEASKK